MEGVGSAVPALAGVTVQSSFCECRHWVPALGLLWSLRHRNSLMSSLKTHTKSQTFVNTVVLESADAMMT